jgi:hypothetical protein
MGLNLFRSRLVTGTRAEQIRVRADVRDGQPVVRVERLEPIAVHAQAMTVVGQPLFISVEQVPALRDAINAACAEAEAEASATDQGRSDEPQG